MSFSNERRYLRAFFPFRQVTHQQIVLLVVSSHSLVQRRINVSLMQI